MSRPPSFPSSRARIARLPFPSPLFVQLTIPSCSCLLSSPIRTYSLHNPIKHGLIDNWDYMERFWEQSIFKYLRAEPEDHHVLLVSPSFLCSYSLCLPTAYSRLELTLMSWIDLSDGASSQPSREQGERCRDHVRVVQRSGSLLSFPLLTSLSTS